MADVESGWWGANPAEHLRAVTRRGDDEEQLASEAASALAGFAFEPAGLVVACRRLLAHHPASAPLWWLSACVLAAPDPAAACRDAAARLDDDPTASRLAGSLPVLDGDEVVAVVGWPSSVDRALSERADIAVVVVRLRARGATRRLRYRESERRVRVLDAWELANTRVVRVLVPARAIGGQHAIVPAGTAEIITTVGDARARAELWLLGGVGRVLPARLFAAAVAASRARIADDDRSAIPDALGAGGATELDDGPVELVDLQRFDRVIGPRGLERPADAAARVECPVVPELLRPF
jgi:hypothetical protein